MFVLNCNRRDLTPLRGRDRGPSTELVFLHGRIFIGRGAKVKAGLTHSAFVSGVGRSPMVVRVSVDQ